MTNKQQNYLRRLTERLTTLLNLRHGAKEIMNLANKIEQSDTSQKLYRNSSELLPLLDDEINGLCRELSALLALLNAETGRREGGQ